MDDTEITNNIPALLQKKGWTKYRFMRYLMERGGFSKSSANKLAYNTLMQPDFGTSQWRTMTQVADVLGVSLNQLETRRKIKSTKGG